MADSRNEGIGEHRTARRGTGACDVAESGWLGTGAGIAMRKTADPDLGLSLFEDFLKTLLAKICACTCLFARIDIFFISY